jgi:putative membrane protein
MAHPTFRPAAVCAALLALGMVGSVAAQNTGPADNTTQGTATSNTESSSKMASGALASGDRKFVEKAATGGMMEVQLGQLAQEKASNEQVKEFAARMAQDHAKANDELKQLATSKGANVPSAVANSQQKDVDKLQKLSGADFDRAYMKQMVSDHKADINDFQKEAKSGKDVDLKSFATTTLPTLQEHMTLAQSTYNAVKNTGAKKSANSQSSTQ